MRLTEEQASQFIADWTAGCQWIAPAPPTLSSASFFAHPRMVVSRIDASGSISQVKEHALGLRRAMEGLNALAVCGGFDPEEKPAFWRRELQWLAMASSMDSPQRLTSTMFSHYEVVSDFVDDASASSMAFGFAICLDLEPSSPAMAVRRDVIAQLRDFLLVTPPILNLVLGSSYYPARHTSTECTKFSDTLHDLVHARALRPTSQRGQSLKLVLGREALPPNNLDFLCSDVSVATTLNTIEVNEIHGNDPDEGLRPFHFNSLMPSLCAEDTVEVMTWDVVSGHSLYAAILFSAVAYMRSLKTFTLIQKRAGTGGPATYEWLAFALKRRQLQGLQLALSMSPDTNEAQAFVRAMRDERTFACLIPEVVRAMVELEYLPLGTTAVPTSKAKPTQELLVDQRHQTSAVFALDRVDVLARCEQKCIVIVPGNGLMWVQTTELTAWETPAGDEAPHMTPRALRVLEIRGAHVADAVWIVKTVHAERTAVVYSTLATEPGLSTTEMELLSECSASIHTLVLPGGEMNASLSSLLSGRCTIETLVIGHNHRPARVATPSPLLDAIFHRGPGATCGLHEISIELVYMTHGCLVALAASLVRNRRVRFIRLLTSAPRDTWAELERQLAVSLGPTARSKVWLYAFLWCVRRSRRWMIFPSLCTQLVVEFAAVQMQRQVVFLASP